MKQQIVVTHDTRELFEYIATAVKQFATDVDQFTKEHHSLIQEERGMLPMKATEQVAQLIANCRALTMTLECLMPAEYRRQFEEPHR